MLFVVEHAHLFPSPLAAIISPQAGGFASLGALLGGSAMGWVYCRKYGIAAGRAADAAAVALPVFAALGRLGCLGAGCCFGKPTILPWGVVLAHGSAQATWGAGVAVHPVQIYEVAFLALIAACLSKIRLTVAGTRFVLLCLSYALFRCLVEQFRGDTLVVPAGLSVPQWITLGIGLASLTVLARAYRGSKPISSFGTMPARLPSNR